MADRAVPLDPDGRATLRDILLPPDGYRLEHALATAYSLDAETLVTIPLFAAGIGAEDLERSVGVAKVYELGTRLTLLVQGDRIAISKRWANSRALLRLVGDAVVPCSIERGSFHPKLLVLEFASVDDADEKLFRVVVATRNLTTDNSWDSVVVLDQSKTGVLVPGMAPAVAGLADFINDRKHPAVERCDRISKALRGVRFQPLAGVTELDVHLFARGRGAGAEVFSKLSGDDLLVISPFVRENFLKDLARKAGRDRDRRWLVTRPADVPPTAFMDYQVFKITDGALPPPPSIARPERKDKGEDGTAERPRGQLVGLHAKVYIASSKKSGTDFVVTSANATLSGWERNVEIAVAGKSKSKAMQVPQLMARGTDELRNFRDMLEEITPEGVAQSEQEPEWERVVRGILSGASAVGRIDVGPPRTLALTLTVGSQGGSWPHDVQAAAHPFGYRNHQADLVRSPDRMTCVLPIAPAIELTPFVVLVLTCGDSLPLEIVLAMQLVGDIDWTREDARKVLAKAARPGLYQELLWYFGVGGQRSRSSNGEKSTASSASEMTRLPILERLLLRVHGPDARAQIETIDGLLAGLTDDPADERLREVWQLVKESVRAGN